MHVFSRRNAADVALCADEEVARELGDQARPRPDRGGQRRVQARLSRLQGSAFAALIASMGYEIDCQGFFKPARSFHGIQEK